MDRVHVYLHVLARLEGLAAHGARVRQVAGRVHVQDVLLEVAVVAVQFAALGARGLGRLTVREGRQRRRRAREAGLRPRRVALLRARPLRAPPGSWADGVRVQCLACLAANVRLSRSRFARLPSVTSIIATGRLAHVSVGVSTREGIV